MFLVNVSSAEYITLLYPRYFKVNDVWRHTRESATGCHGGCTVLEPRSQDRSGPACLGARSTQRPTTTTRRRAGPNVAIFLPAAAETRALAAASAYTVIEWNFTRMSDGKAFTSLAQFWGICTLLYYWTHTGTFSSGGKVEAVSYPQFCTSFCFRSMSGSLKSFWIAFLSFATKGMLHGATVRIRTLRAEER